MSDLVYLLAAYGVVFGLMNDKLPGGVVKLYRRSSFLNRMLECSFCTGFHAGWIVWLLRLSSTETGSVLVAATSCVTWALASAAFCYAADNALRWVETATAEGSGDAG